MKPLPPPTDPDETRLGAWELPYQDNPDGPQNIELGGDAFIADSVTIGAALVEGPLGPLPTLVLDYGNSHDGGTRRIVLLGHEDSLKASARLMGTAADRASLLTGRKRRSWRRGRRS